MAKVQNGRAYLARGRQTTKSVSTPSAQNVKLLQARTYEVAALNTLKRIAQEGVNRHGVYAVGIDLMVSGGLRLSEVIVAKSIFVNEVGQVLIKGTKGSADKLVTPLYCADFWRKYHGWCVNPCSLWSRWSWYRVFKKAGIVVHEDGKKNCTVTHVARKIQAHSLFNAGVEIGSIADVMGHRSISSTEFYNPNRGGRAHRKYRG